METGAHFAVERTDLAGLSADPLEDLYGALAATREVVADFLDLIDEPAFASLGRAYDRALARTYGELCARQRARPALVLIATEHER